MFFKHRLRLPIIASLALCVVGWWLSLGVQGGLYPVVFRVVPGAKAFHDPARFLHYVHLGVPLAIGGVLSILETFKTGRIVSTVLGLVNVTSLLLLAPKWYPLVTSQVWLDAQEFYKPLGASVVYTQNDRSVWLTYANPKSFAGVQTDKSVRDFLMSGIPNIPGTWGVVSVGGYEPVAPKSSMSMQGWTCAKPQVNLAVLSELGVTDVVTSSGTTSKLPNNNDEQAESVSRVTNGWDVHPVSQKDRVRIKALRTAGWNVVSGKAVIDSESESHGELLVLGTGQIAYHPASFRIGLFFTLIALGILAGITLHTVQNARKV
jgi:hypothetical protein